ncbi:MAG: hypothetical protein NVSMB51_18770 [Solirubrobacteraceae bacterium]
MERRTELGLIGAMAAVALAGCGGGTRQDAHESSGTYKVQVVRATFPVKQRVAQATQMNIVVRNIGGTTIPDLAVTIDSFNRRDTAPGVADPSRPVWIVDGGPSGGDTAYNNTWALGPLPAGQSRKFTWRVTAIDPGRFHVRYRLAAGLSGKAVAKLDDGSPAEGNWTVAVSSRPPAASVDPNTGRIVRPSGGQSAGSNASGGAGSSSAGQAGGGAGQSPPPGY